MIKARQAPDLPATPLQFIVYFAGRFWGWIAAMLFLEAGQAACNILMPYAIAQIIEAVNKAGSPSLEALQTPLILFVSLNIGEIFFSRSSGACSIIYNPRLKKDVCSKLYAYLQHHSQRYFSNHFSGSLAHRISDTATSLQHTFGTIIFEFWPITIVFGVSIFLLARVHLNLVLFISAWIFLYVLISFWLAMRCQPYAKAMASQGSQVNGKIVDALSNMTAVKLFSRLDFEQGYLNRYLQDEASVSVKGGWYMDRVRWFMFISAVILKVGTLYYALTLWRQGVIGVSDFVMCTSLTLLIINDAKNLSRRFLDFFGFLGNIANGVNNIVQSHELVDLADAPDLKLNKGSIEFKEVDFGYSENHRVFNRLNLSIPARQKVGLVGFSGSGKSTFVNLILRSYDPQKGAILIDGFDIKAVSQDSLHSQIGLIPQDPSLFQRTLMENIRYGRIEASDVEVIEAAKAAHAHDFIQGLDKRYDTLVGERGMKLSGGQRQRIAIARIILKNAPILIMDEATSSLDSVTEQIIQESLTDIMHDKTVIVIAHRLSTIAHLDRILVFDSGKIVEDGSHAELMALDGHYARLWNKQIGGFLPEIG